MESDDIFEPVVEVTKQFAGTKITHDDESATTLQYFKTNGYHVIGAADEGYEKIGVMLENLM